ncbi:FMN-binding protein [Clostridium estertheticum]|uniref:FMN-binding protein n=1 Tax=Clostridium estertheticum TaxID=238834 RepID=A0AA47I8K5_9CLOT|nr:FMN-binding protein [Clostridium estertheticum]MBU3157491.1 FMN-binding protein [Clostridium estertheticum]WAG62180.1 FMN-binding protein [Clostridium estertheticum]
MVKKIKKTQIFRHIIQLIMFVLSPGLFILAFSELKSIYTMIIKGNLNFITAFPTLIEFTTVIIVTIFLGRFFCGWVCAFGAYNDFIYLLSKKVFKVNFKVNEEVDKVLKYVKYVVLLLLVIIVWTMGSKVLDTTSPWDAFAQITNFPQVLFDYTIGVALLLLITLGALFVERFFCRYLCPLGAVFNILSRIGILKIKKPTDKCGKCRLCTNNCSMGLSLYKAQSVCGGDCINCFKCIEACPRSNTKINVLGENVNPELASGVAIAAMVGLYAVNNLGAQALANSGLATASTTSTSTSSTSQKYKDGTYTGTGTGFHGATTEMSVTIKDNKITKVETVSNGDTPDFYARAESTITSEIISNQSTSVDTVSGATYSSEGIISATQEALKKAEVGSSATTPTTTDTSTTTDSSTDVADTNTTTDSTATTANTYKDGTYTGSGSGFHGGTTQMSVTIKDNKITKVETVSNGDTPDFYVRAESTIISQIVSTQSTTVDTVSGATYSSEGIISATQEALSKAKA